MKVHFKALDGIRGLAALWVVLGHARAEMEADGSNTVVFQLLKIIHETCAVPAFIVLSGFLLAYPFVGKEPGEWKGPWNFMVRRFRRIYPTFLAVIVLCLVLDRFAPWGANATQRWLISQPVSWKSVIAHVLNIQNFTGNWRYNIDPPMWSLAYEWQFYIVFAVCIVPLLIKQKWGLALAAFVAALAGLSMLKLGFGMLFFGFGLGILSAFVVQRVRIKLWLPACSFVASAILALNTQASVETFFSCICATSLIFCTVGNDSKENQTVRGVFESRPCMLLGAVSYSLYLVHYPLLSGLNSVLRQTTLDVSVRAYAVCILGPAISLWVAYFLAKTIEYRLLNNMPEVLRDQPREGFRLRTAFASLSR